MGAKSSRQHDRESQQRLTAVQGPGPGARGPPPHQHQHQHQHQRRSSRRQREETRGRRQRQPAPLPFRGPPRGFYRGPPPGLQHPPALPPEVAETETIVNSVHLDKTTLAIEKIPGSDAYHLSFATNCEVPARVTLKFATIEKPDPKNNQIPIFESQNPSIGVHSIDVGYTVVGENVTMRCESELELSNFKAYFKYRDTHKGHYPLVIILDYVDESGSDEIRQLTYAEVKTCTDGPGGLSYQIEPIRQRLQVKGALYELEDIFGSPEVAHGQPVEGVPGDIEAVEDTEGDQCVVCISEDRDTIVMPCRHLCLCGDCAKLLRQQSNKCPICRTPIERLITRKKGAEAAD